MKFPDAGLAALADNEGYTPLHATRNLEISRLLLEHGASVNARNSHGISPLHSAAARSLAIFQLFMERRHGADILTVDQDGYTPFDRTYGEAADYILTVAYREHVIEHEGNRAMHAILEAAQYRYLVDEDDSDSEEDDAEEPLLQVRLPLGRLSIHGFLSLVRALLRSFDGNPLLQPNNTGALPFHVACRSGAPVEILIVLLEEYPEALNIADDNGSLPIHFACQANNPSLAVLKFLLERIPGTIFVRDNTGALPLHRLCEAEPSKDSMVFLLEAYNGSVSVRTNSGDLPVMLACTARASQSVVGILLRAYPDALEYMRDLYNP